MIMSSERGSMSLSQLCESSSLSFSLCSLVLLLSLVFLSTFSAVSLSLSLSLSLPSPCPPPSLSLSLSFPPFLSLSSVLKGPRTNYQKGHFHLWTAGFNRYLFHAFKINPILLLSVWFVYFALEYSFGGRGEMHGMQFTLNLHYIGFLYWLIKHAKRTFP